MPTSENLKLAPKSTTSDNIWYRIALELEKIAKKNMSGRATGRQRPKIKIVNPPRVADS